MRTFPQLRDPAAPGAAVAVALVLSGALVLLWLLNYWAALMLIPAAHLWMLATLVEPAPPGRARALLIALGSLPAVLVALYWLIALSLGPLGAAWYVLLLVIGGGIELSTVLLACVVLTALGATIAIARARRSPPPEAPADGPAVYGPGSYAGPGSLGGTESALRQ